MAVDLEALDPTLNSATLALLGDTITYTPNSTAGPTIKAIVDHAQNIEQFSGSKITRDDLAVEVAKTDVEEPSGEDRIELPRRPGETFKPKDWTSDESGMNWLILLQSVPT